MTNSELDDGAPCDALADSPIDSRGDPRVERTRSVVLDAGVELLFEHGPDGVSHATVAAAARVSRTTLYKHWPHRGDLLFDIMNQVEPQKVVEPTGDIRTDIARRAEEMSAAFADPRLNKIFSSLIAQAQWDDETSRARDALVGAAMADMEVLLDHAVARGQLPTGIDPVDAAGRLVGPMFFAALVVGIPIEGDGVDRLVDEWLALYQA